MNCRILAVILSVLLCLTGVAFADENDGLTYNVFVCDYDAADVQGWQAVRNAETEGVLLSLYTDTSELLISLEETSEGADVQELAAQKLSSVSGYASVIGEPVYEDWYPSWNSTVGGIRMTYSYSYLGGDGGSAYQTVDYIAILDDQHYVLAELTDWSGDVSGVQSRLESGLLKNFSIGSFEVSDGENAYLTGAYASDGRVYISLMPFDVSMTENDSDYAISLTGETINLPLSEDCVIQLPEGDDTGMVSPVDPTEAALKSYIDGYRDANGDDCAVHVLKSGGEVRWISFSYLY